MGLKHGISQIGNTLSQVFNVMCNPFSENTLAHETFSARCGRLGDQKPYTFCKAVVDALALPFDGPNHCERAHQKERARYSKQP